MSITINSLNDYSTLFSSLNQNSNNTTSLFSSNSMINLGVNLSDYASIKSGAYHKLLKAYYAKAEDSSQSTSSTKSKTPTTAKAKANELAEIDNSADSLKDAADALLARGSKSVFNKVEQTDEDGNKTSGYDTDAIYNSVNKFVNAYNDMLESADGTDNKNIYNHTVSAIRYTQSNEKSLESIGITVGSDYQLSIDEDKFKAADMSTVKSLFNTTGSYGYQISAKASMVSYYAERAASDVTTYGSNGAYSYNYMSGSIYNSWT